MNTRYTIVLIILFTSALSQLTNTKDVCSTLKSHLFKTVGVLKDMNPEQRDRLYKYSMRGIAYDVMKIANFSSNDMNIKKNAILESLVKLRTEFQGWNKLNLQEEEEEELENKFSAELDSASNAQVSNNELRNQNADNNFRQTEILKNVKNKLLTNNPELEAKNKMIKELEGIVSIMESVQSYSDNFLEILDNVQKILDNSHVEALKQLTTFRQTLKDYLLSNDIYETNNQAILDFNLVEVDGGTTNIQNVKSDSNALQYELENLKYYFKIEINSIIDKTSQEILAIPDYVAYQNALKVSKELITKGNIIYLNDIEITEKLSFAMNQLNTLNYQKIRIHPREINEFLRKLENLGRFKNMNSANFSNETIQNESLKKNAKDFFKINTTRLSDLNTLYNNMQSEWTNFKNLHNKEIELDELFGKVFAELQGGQNPKNGFINCFVNLEVSVYMFYMNMLQIVVSKKSFYHNFMNNLDPKTQLNLVKQFFKDLQNKPFRDPSMIDEFNDSFSHEGLEQSMKNYVMVTNLEMDNIFSKQMNVSEDPNDSWYYYIINYIGFTSDFVWKVVKKGTLSILFKAIALGLLAFFTTSSISIIAIVFVTAFIAIISELFFVWIGNQISNYQWIKPQFYKGIADLYAMFTPSKLDSLDYETILENERQITLEKEIDSRNKKTETEEFDLVMSYRMKFETFAFYMKSNNVDFDQYEII